MTVDIYDFDKTLIPYDSGSKFFLYCLAHYPWIVITVPFTVIAVLLHLLGIIDMNRCKSCIFWFVALIPTEKAVGKFWQKHGRDFYPFARSEKKNYSVVISASPDFLISSAVKDLGFDALICTKHNPRTGVLVSENCRDEEKVKRFREEFPGSRVENVYSDSYRHDRPIFSLGTKCWHIEPDGSKTAFDYAEQYK